MERFIKLIMPRCTPWLILLLVFIFAFNRGFGQAQPPNCEGSLGDPVFSIDFGAGDNPGPRLPPGFTNLVYSTKCPEGGIYAIVNNTNILGGSSNCHAGTWESVMHDHSGYPNGYMMLINASSEPSIFFQKTTDAVLCENTTYEFSAYILNMMTLAASGGTVQPDIEFSIETIDGQPLAHIERNIGPSKGPEDWVKASVFFTTPANTSRVVLKMTNKTIGDNGNDLVLDDITFRACGPPVQTFFDVTGNTRVQNICTGENKSYVLKSEPIGVYAHPVKQWQQNINDGGWHDIPGATSVDCNISIANALLGTYKYRLAAAEGENINSLNCRVYADPLIVNVSAAPVVPVIAPVAACEGDAVSINTGGGVSYEWHGPGITAANKNQNPLVFTHIVQANGGSYYVDVISAGGCATVSNTFQVAVNPKPVVITAGKTVNICQGASTVLHVAEVAGASYQWTPAAGLSNPTLPNPLANPTDTTTYNVAVTTASGCTAYTDVTVNVLPKPMADAGKPAMIFEGQWVILNGKASNANVYQWAPATGLSDPTILNPIATPIDDIVYTLHVSSTYNCGTDESSVFVRVYKKIIIPNSFSPNGDGTNDFWDIEALVTYPQSVLTVFNRYGQPVFKSIGYAKPWHGTYNGAALPTGTYYYTIDLKNGAPKLSGWVLIVK